MTLNMQTSHLSNSSLRSNTKILGSGKYELHKSGTVIYLSSNKFHKFKKVRIDRAGYNTIRMCKHGKTKTYFVHRLLAEAFIPNPLNKPFVNHINGVKTDNRIENLEWVSHSENIIHAYKNGLISKKSLEKKVIDIQSGKIYKSVIVASLNSGVSYSTLKNYLNGKRKNRTNLILFNKWKWGIIEKTFPCLGLSLISLFWHTLESYGDSYAQAS